jgi:DNA-binding transcriptional MerR regulator
MTDVIIYSASDVYKRLEISDSTLRKYMEVLQREGYAVQKDKRGRREYTEYDVMVLEKLIELSKHDGMTLEKAAKLITQQLGNPDINEKTEESQGTDLISYHIQQQLQQQYSVMAKEMNRNLLEMEQRLSQQAEQSNKRIEESIERRNERIEKRLEERDKNLIKTLREIQETKRIMKEYHEEVAATKDKKKHWWKFW